MLNGLIIALLQVTLFGLLKKVSPCPLSQSCHSWTSWLIAHTPCHRNPTCSTVAVLKQENEKYLRKGELLSNVMPVESFLCYFLPSNCEEVMGRASSLHGLWDDQLTALTLTVNFTSQQALAACVFGSLFCSEGFWLVTVVCLWW